MTPLYFAYGSNMSTYRLRSRILSARPYRRGWLEGWRLACNKPSRDRSGKANVLRADDPNAAVWGVLYHIPHRDWSRLDDFEPGYRRTSCRVGIDGGGAVDAQVYLADAPLVARPPHGWYRDYLVEGAVEHALPREYVATIRSWEVLPSEDPEDPRHQGFHSAVHSL